MPRALCWVVTAAALFAANSSAAAPPVPPHIEAPPCIALVGSQGGVPAAGGRFEVWVGYGSGLPVENMPVAVDLSQCFDLHLCTDQRDPTLVVDCAAHTVVALTDASGIARFTLLGGSRAYTGGGPSSIGARGRIYLPPMFYTAVSVTVTAYDLDGNYGLGANDFSIWLTDFASGVPWARSDYDGSGSIGANDLSLWLQAFSEWYVPESCAASCL